MARPFVTASQHAGHGSLPSGRPELYLKRLTVGGIERVFEINRNFRNEGISTQHNPEFTMMEFYEAYADYQALMRMTEEMILDVVQPVHGGRSPLRRPSDLVQGSFRPTVLAWPYVPHEPKTWPACVAEADLRNRETPPAIAKQLGVEVQTGQGAGKITTSLFEALCEAGLIQPTFVYDFPTEVSPLSKQKPDDSDTVERFELYIGGFEVANAFSELNDPVEQRRRFEAQLNDRARGSRGPRDGRRLHPGARIWASADRRRRPRASTGW